MLDKVDTSRVPDGVCQYGSHEKQVRAVNQHGYPIDFWDDEAAEAEETAFETACIWIACGVIVSVAAFFFWY